MKKYFYTDGTTKFGPFTYDELKEKGITRETMVWFQELNEWKPAGEVLELSDIFKLVPPLITKSSSNFNNMDNFNSQQPPKSWLVESILATILCCLPFGIAGIVNASRVESRFYSGDIEGANRASAEAKKWTLISFWIGIVGIVLYLLLIAISIATGGG